MALPTRRPPDAELKLTTLYALKRLGPCTDLVLLQFLFGYDLMNYIEMMIALSDLCKDGQVARVAQEAAWRYEVTKAGIDTLALFENRIPLSIRELVDQNAPAYIDAIRLTRERKSAIVQTPRGEYEVTLTLEEKDMQLIKVTLSLPTKELALSMEQGWRKQAGDVYGHIVALMREENA